MKHTMDDTTGFETPEPIINVSAIWPPIPTRAFDYCATYDGDEPDDDGNIEAGYGKTREEAIADLRTNYPR